jgi:adenylate cyclase
MTAAAAAEPAARPTEAERTLRAVRAHLRQEFVAPASAIVGYAEMLLDDARRLGPPEAVADLERIRTAGLALQALIGEVLASETSPADPDAFRSKLRHDLRTPINAVKGYGEMLLEDAEADGRPEFAQDLRRLLVAAEGMLGRIDTLLEVTADAGIAETQTGARGLVSRAFESMRPAARDTGRGPAGRILVVDDNESNRDLLARQLTRDGHTIALAANGTEALELVGSRPFDLVLLDLMMPDISGYEVLLRLKAEPGTRDIPVIMISALDEMDSIVRCIEAGAIDYLPKPFDRTLLHARIASSLENKLLRDRERQILEELRIEKDRNDALLLSILPQAVVDRIKAGDSLVADQVPEATILFADIVGFTRLAARLGAADLVQFLNTVFSTFDRLAELHGAERIKTIGDAYMVATGLPATRPDHVEAGARLALAIRDATEELRRDGDPGLALRIGLHCGPVIAGVIGDRKFAYDVWGHTVNLASRLESHGVPGKIHCSERIHRRLGDRFAFDPRGEIEIKGSGNASTFFLLGERETAGG